MTDAGQFVHRTRGPSHSGGWELTLTLGVPTHQAVHHGTNLCLSTGRGVFFLICSPVDNHQVGSSIFPLLPGCSFLLRDPT